ncbi:DUF4013 domain-containing protein [Anaerolineales bacterium HSG25]|nr:DUF4013 domain-containing protein [Anaerolineales bacterium HSG25]
MFLVGIPLVFLYYGYWLQTMTQVRDGQAIPLPEWGNWGELFSKGGMVLVITLIYNLPILLIACCMFGLAIPGMFAPGDMQEAVGAFVGIMGLCLSCVSIIVIFVVNLMVPAALIRFAQTGQFNSAFEFKEILAFIRNNFSDYLIMFVVIWAANFIASFGIILCGIGQAFTGFWALLVSAHLNGQLATKMNGGSATPDIAPVGF